MPRTLDYWFSLVSPWAFLGHQAFLDLARQHSVTIKFKPVEYRRCFRTPAACRCRSAIRRASAIAS